MALSVRMGECPAAKNWSAIFSIDLTRGTYLLQTKVWERNPNLAWNAGQTGTAVLLHPLLNL